MSTATFLGPIVHLQIARIRLRARDERQTYTPEPLMTPDDYLLTRDGVIGGTADGWLLDRHHSAHPDNVSPDPDRVLSLGFTSHYRAMADRFGPVDLGAAGENVIVDTGDMVALDMIGGGLEIRSGDGTIDLGRPEIAEPCVYFTRFMMGGGDPSPDEIKPARDFLRNGMRGFVVGLGALDASVAVHLGDEVWAYPSD